MPMRKEKIKLKEGFDGRRYISSRPQIPRQREIMPDMIMKLNRS